MSIQAVLLPVFVSVALTFFLLFWMGRRRVGALRSGQVKMADIALGQNAWPAASMQVARAFHNQLEVPMLFYVLVVLAIIAQKDDLLFVVMEWLWVATRLAHAFVHTTSNRVTLRFQLFAAGVGILLLMWIIFAGRVLIA